jgi:phospho-N-acetylmuramoyl-pentapeptide-transferase
MISLQVVRLLVLAGVSFFVALAVTPFVTKLLYRLRAGKQIRNTSEAPVFYQLHQKKEGTPTMGGIIIWGTVIGLSVLFFALAIAFDGTWSYLNVVDRAETYLPIIAMLIAALLGFADDVLGTLKKGPNGGGMAVKHKLLIYVLLGLLGAWWFYQKLGWTVLSIPFVGTVAIDGWYIPVFIFVIAATAFSANETDGLDGLLGGTSLFTFASLTVVSFALGRYELAAFSSIVIGSLLAFLWFNIYPARFFMGDTGSMALGITMGVIALLTNTALFLPFFAPILVLESLSVIVQMISKKAFKRKIFISTPIHHHFEALGWPETRVTMRFWIITAVSNGIGLVLFFLSRSILQ